MRNLGATGFFLERASAILLVFLLAAHFIVIHFQGAGEDAWSHGAIFLRLSSPLWLVFYIIFLSVLLYHGFYGLWGIAVEYVRRVSLLAAIRACLVAVSLALWASGIFILANSQMLLANPPALCYKCHARGSIPSYRAMRFFGLHRPWQ